MKKGYFIVLEGSDMSGKTTQAEFLNQKLQDSIVLNEPTNKKYGKILRENFKKRTLSKKEEVELFIQDRIEHQKEINNLLGNGINVIMDRYHYSTIAYQILDDKLRNYYLELIDKHNYFRKIKIPDLTFILQINYDTFIKRKKQRIKKQKLDSFESDDDLMERVIDFYNNFTQDNLIGFGPIVKIDGKRDIFSVHSSILNITKEILFWEI